jgi:glycosyltransferase involved in cell wall biosynthesis
MPAAPARPPPDDTIHRSGLSRAYNLAIASTTGQYIACTDDDCIVPADWIEKIVKAFEEQRDGDQSRDGRAQEAADEHHGPSV